MVHLAGGSPRPGGGTGPAGPDVTRGRRDGPLISRRRGRRWYWVRSPLWGGFLGACSAVRPAARPDVEASAGGPSASVVGLATPGQRGAADQDLRRGE